MQHLPKHESQFLAGCTSTPEQAKQIMYPVHLEEREGERERGVKMLSRPSSHSMISKECPSTISANVQTLDARLWSIQR